MIGLVYLLLHCPFQLSSFHTGFNCVLNLEIDDFVGICKTEFALYIKLVICSVQIFKFVGCSIIEHRLQITNFCSVLRSGIMSKQHADMMKDISQRYPVQ
jgi:hypothetical protein